MLSGKNLIDELLTSTQGASTCKKLTLTTDFKDEHAEKIKKRKLIKSSPKDEDGFVYQTKRKRKLLEVKKCYNYITLLLYYSQTGQQNPTADHVSNLTIKVRYR